MADMQYRRLGRSGLQVSVLSFGSWVSFGAQLDTGAALECLDAAYQGGMNFFDNAEAYAGGDSERIMGEAIAHTYAREGARVAVLDVNEQAAQRVAAAIGAMVGWVPNRV